MTHQKKHHDKEHPDASPAPKPPAPPVNEAVAAPLPLAADDPMAKLKAERDDYLLRLQRVSADFLNYQKRAQREMAETREYANADLMKALLPALDDLERAMEAAAKTAPADDPLLKGVQLVHQKALTAMETFGLKHTPSEGTPFDPQKHQAVVHMPTDEQPPNMVLKELQRGYQLRGRTLRPATVVVSSEPQTEEKTENE